MSNWIKFTLFIVNGQIIFALIAFSVFFTITALSSQSYYSFLVLVPAWVIAYDQGVKYFNKLTSRRYTSIELLFMFMALPLGVIIAPGLYLSQK